MSSTNPSKPDALVGSVINGRYRVGPLVAAGGMGRVYRAEQLPLERTVALKVLHAATTSNVDEASFKKRFFREASILSKLQHPNIVTVFDYGAIDGPGDRYFMAMEFLEGQTLLRRIHEQGSLAPRDTIRYAKQIALGLREAHAAGIVHRDLKPANVMLVASRKALRESESELVKVLDFGIVKVVGEEDDPLEELTQEGSFIGSPKYMAPEQIRRGATVDPRTDVYSLGIILYQCLCGEVPFDAANSIETMMLHLNKAAVPIRERAPRANAPEWLEELVMACLAKDPNERPQTMDAVVQILTSGEMPTAPRIASLDRMHIAASSPREVTDPSTGTTQKRAVELTDQPTITENGASASLPPREAPALSIPAPRPRVSPGTIAALVLAALLVFVIVRGSERRVAGPAAEVVTPSPAAAPAAAPAHVASEATGQRAFRLVVESLPSGAEVREGTELLGTTPLALSVDNVEARKQPKKLTIAREGYQPYSIVQGPSDESVRVLATLAALPEPAPAASTPAAPPALHRTRSESAKPDSGSTLDIRLTR